MNRPTHNLILRRFAAALSVAFVAAIGFGATSASAHTFQATGECGAANLRWTSFASSGSVPANKVDWTIVKDSASQSLAAGQNSFTGTSDELEVSVPSSNGSYLVSSSWTGANTRDGHTGSGQSTFQLKSCIGLSTTASPAIVLGDQISDTAHLSGGTDDVGGTIEFNLYADTDSQCTTSLTTSTVPVTGNDNYQSASYTPTASGGYQWTATYSGDSKNDGSGPHGCGVPAEHVTVSEPPPVVTPPVVTPPAETPPGETPPVVTPVPPKTPGQGVNSVCRTAPGQLSLNGPSGNVRNQFKVKVRSQGFNRISVYVDGRKIKTSRFSSGKKRTLSIRVNPRKLKPGVHRIRVVARFGPAKCGTTKRTLSFVRARAAQVSPEFTG